jgi:integrase/recombinase XerD
MRRSALVALENDDVDLGDGLLTLRHTKFGKSRCLPLHPTTRQALGGDVPLRDRVYPIPNGPSLFVSAPGPRLTPWPVRATFVPLSCQIGWRDPTDS